MGPFVSENYCFRLPAVRKPPRTSQTDYGPVVQIWGSDKNNEKTNIFQSSPSCSASVAVDHLTISLNSWWDRRQASGPGWKQLSKNLHRNKHGKPEWQSFTIFCDIFSETSCHCTSFERNKYATIYQHVAPYSTTIPWFES